MKALSPKAVRTVRIPSLEQGTNSIRLLNIKALPDDMNITENAGPKNKVYDFTNDPQASDRLRSLSWGMTETDEPGRWKNFEVEFAYRRLPPPADRSANTHFLLYLGVGVKKVAKFEIPVWVELSGLHGKIRLRMQLVPEPPFSKSARVTSQRISLLIRDVNSQEPPILIPDLASYGDCRKTAQEHQRHDPSRLLALHPQIGQLGLVQLYCASKLRARHLAVLLGL